MKTMISKKKERKKKMMHLVLGRVQLKKEFNF